MGVTKTTISEGNGPSPQKGDTVTMLYTGWLKNADGSKGKEFDSTQKPGRGPFKTPIGVGRVIKGKLCSSGLPWSSQAQKLNGNRLGRGCRPDEARREGDA